PVGSGPFTRQPKRERAARRTRRVARPSLAGCVGPREGARDTAEPFGGGAPQDVVVEVDRRLPGKAEHVVLDQGDGERVDVGVVDIEERWPVAPRGHAVTDVVEERV